VYDVINSLNQYIKVVGSCDCLLLLAFPTLSATDYDPTGMLQCWVTCGSHPS
jgi:hypothetical protein